MPEKTVGIMKLLSQIATIVAIAGLIGTQAVNNYKTDTVTVKVEKHCEMDINKDRSLAEVLSNVNTTMAVQTEQLKYLTQEVKMLREKKGY